MLGDNIPQVQLADVAGALSYRQGQIDKDAERRKEIVTNQLAGQALSAGLQEGTPLYELAKANPNAYVGLSKAIGIDPADGSGMHQMATDSAHIAQLMNVDDSGQLAAQYMQSEADRRGKLGLPTDYLTKGLQHLQQNTGTFKNTITMAANAFNPPDKKELVSVAQGAKLYDPSTKTIVAENPKQFDPNDPSSQVKVHSGTILPDGTTVSLMSDGTTQVQSPEGKPLTGPDRIDAVKQARQYGVDIAGSTSGAKAKATSEAGMITSAKQSENKSAQLATAINQAEALLPKATGSYAGAAVDAMGHVIGVTSPSSLAASQLDTISGWMTANVPRMEGPQSDKDVENYRIMAAKVGDRTVPTKERLASLQTLKELQNKYSDLNKNIATGGQNTFDTKKEALSLDDLVNKYAK